MRTTPPLSVPTPKQVSAPVGATVQEHLPYWQCVLDEMAFDGYDAGYVQRVRREPIYGVTIRPSAPPRGGAISNTPAVRRHLSSCKERVAYYQGIRALEVLGEVQDIVQPLHVVTKKGKKPRLVLDLSRNLNGLWEPQPFKYQSFDRAVELSAPGCFYAKLDRCFVFPMT